MTDWYRRKTWTKIDEDEFFAKLGRARKDGRAQYLKIQAIELVSTKNVELLKVAKTLLNKLLAEYPNDDFNKGSALHTLGNIYRQLDDYDIAIDYYKQALDFELIYPNVRTQAYLDYSELIIKNNKIEKYDDVENILLDRYSGLLFPIEKYKVNSIMSIINKDKNRPDKAKHYAELAEKNATAEISELRYHKNLGVVKERENWLDKLVES
nr:tetratricopeptide repeat protein [Flavobacterium sp. ASV13]